MIIELTNLLLLLVFHFVGDFILQSDRVAINKSKNSLILLEHVALYSIPFFWFGWKFAILNASLHFFVDYFSSRITTYLYPRNRHWFFVVIGLDQMLHIMMLSSTFILLLD